MKTLIYSAVIGLTIIGAAAPAFAQSHHGPHHGPVHVHKQVTHKHVTKKVVVVKKQRWARGHALPSHYRQHHVRDYHSYHLRAPGRGQRWVRVDNQFILINAVSGMIAALAATR
ncbi:RcnB family protein [Bosea sp. BH3]|uniref:RcnB family protein n=1 Tax=Bosea sp. BH3 TaxID=2871701 RepID=UPI0021CB13D7|nr:RcnB family protein [Bosea sp. BH3]MCU4180665.1 RcnB family protein [Bosea sp. BH3]